MGVEKLMGLRSSSLAKKNDDTLTWVLHKKNPPRRETDQKPNETENVNFVVRKSYVVDSNVPAEYRERRYNDRVQKQRRDQAHSNVLDYDKSEQSYGYGITDLDDFLTKASIGRPGNIPVVLCTGCLLYQTQLDDHYQTEVALPLGMVVNAVFKNEQWLYVQTPHAEEGYVPYGCCLPLGIAPPPPDAAAAPCWETQSDVFPRPVGDRRRCRNHHRDHNHHRRHDHHHRRHHRPSGARSSIGGTANDFNDSDDDTDVVTLPSYRSRRRDGAARSITGYGYL